MYPPLQPNMQLRENYRKIIRYENDIKNQIEMQNKLLDDIELKYEAILDYETDVDQNYNVEYDFMDEVSRDDLLDKIETLRRSNEESDKLIQQLKNEELTLQNSLESTKRNSKASKERLDQLEDDNINHNLEKLERENTLLSEKYVYFL